MTQVRAVFLDRDGVLNQARLRDGRPHPPATLEEVELVAGVATCLNTLKQLGFFLVVVTNQPDVARGSQTRETVEAIHHWLRDRLPVDEFRVCYHNDSASCDCRKPKPGLILQTAAERQIDLRRSYLIGDRWRDIDAGAAAGCTTVWIDYQYKERGPTHAPHARVRNLCEAVKWICEQEGMPNAL